VPGAAAVLHHTRLEVSAAEVVETHTGMLCVLADDGFPWVLFTHVEGREYDFGRIGQVAEAARRLAQFHAVAEAFPGPHYEMCSLLHIIGSVESHW
jgi:Ser/Thr protein kinase RdoA (MazF antagonist)